MTIASVTELLEGVRNHVWEDNPGLQQVRTDLARAKAEAVEKCDQTTAKHVWCLETILDIQTAYTDAFRELKSGQHYPAWCKFEHAEISALHGAKHCEHGWGMFHVPFILTQIEKLQALFPYRYFVSPAMLHKQMKCSICGKEISLRRPCGHIRGEIYNGELCTRVVLKFEVLEISIVTNPVQKYSVVFPGGDDEPDPYDYTLVDYVTRGLRTPFDDWKTTWTTMRYPHSLYSHIPPTDPCPCGAARTYAGCCLMEEGVLGPHVAVEFSSPPPADLPRLVLPKASQARMRRTGRGERCAEPLEDG
jgi:hypothetical protein